MMEESEEQRIRWLLDKIYEIRKKKLMNYDALIEEAIRLNKELEKTRQEFTKVAPSERLEVIKYTAIIKSFSNQKALLGELRQILNSLHKEEARYEKELLKMGIDK